MWSVRVDDPDAALEAVVKGALATAAGEDLGLDHGIVTACARISPAYSTTTPPPQLQHVPISVAIFSASAALVATPPLGTPIPYWSSC